MSTPMRRTKLWFVVQWPLTIVGVGLSIVAARLPVIHITYDSEKNGRSLLQSVSMTIPGRMFAPYMIRMFSSPYPPTVGWKSQVSSDFQLWQQGCQCSLSLI
eukprot:2230573-Amphidinium_carterae.2